MGITYFALETISYLGVGDDVTSGKKIMVLLRNNFIDGSHLAQIMHGNIIFA